MERQEIEPYFTLSFSCSVSDQIRKTTKEENAAGRQKDKPLNR